ncbi:MAG: hypothetical protein F6K30_04085 [Cyanothece sp. SIO2G6]|nr:hypothetical protein [Cyanothece sp. SIO2G6]
MNRSQLPLTHEVRFCVSGAVNIHPTAAIATNVVLHANPGSSIEIGAGVVLGQGSIIHSYGGALVLETEVTLGTQVLLFGHGTVGYHGCIGSMTTIMGRIQVAVGESIPPYTLQGDGEEPLAVASPPKVTDTPTELNSSQNINTNSHNPEKRDSMDAVGESVDNRNMNNVAANPGVVNSTSANSTSNVNSTSNNATGVEDAIANDPAPNEPSSPSPSVVYGQASVQRLISMMFPHRSQTLSDNGQE